jgi:hypothetical protein
VSKAVLRLDWCTHEAAKYACETWHYSRSVPASKNLRVGVWEDGKFIGAVIFASGNNCHIGDPYGVTALEACELVRVALTKHKTPVSRVLTIACRFLRSKCGGLRLIVSYADPAQGHHGGIYQAAGWRYVGRSTEVRGFELDGRLLHRRRYEGDNYGRARDALPPGAVAVKREKKHKYLLPLDDAMRAQIAPLAKPYPKRVQDPRVGKSSPGGTTTGEGGAIPTPTL